MVFLCHFWSHLQGRNIFQGDFTPKCKVVLIWTEQWTECWKCKWTWTQAWLVPLLCWGTPSFCIALRETLFSHLTRFGLPLSVSLLSMWVSWRREEVREEGRKSIFPQTHSSNSPEPLLLGGSKGSRAGLKTKAVWLQIIAVAAKGFLSSVVSYIRINSKLIIL